MPAASLSPIFRDARRDEVPIIARLLADDALGRMREAGDGGEALAPTYLSAFDAIAADPNNRLIVVDHGGDVIGCMQLTIIPQMTFTGGKRLQIEGVRIGGAHRGGGIGAAMIDWAIAFAREEGCHLVQLTSNKSRSDALRFYEECGFEPSHVGYKLYIVE